MTDKFARETATRAHKRITTTTEELNARIATLERALTRRSAFHNRCHLCGNPCSTKRRYCHAHAWAEGTEDGVD